MFINNSNDIHNLNSRGVLDNDYYNHACLAYKSLSYVTPHTYRPDDTSKLINTGERLYEGFFQSAVDYSDYELPNQNFCPFSKMWV